MSDVIHLVQGDTLPSVTFALYDERVDPLGNITQVPVDLTDTAVARLKFRQSGATALTDVLVGQVLAPAALGNVTFTWTALSLAGSPGQYEGEIELTQSGGAVFTVYDIQKFKVRAQF